MTNLKEIFNIGVTLAFALLLFIYWIQLQAADNITEAVDVFSQTLLVVLYTFIPTSPVGAIISMTAGAIGAAISADSLGPRPIGILVAFGFFYTATNIVINWFMVPI